ncbi:DUF2878 domain-containing protein [Neptunicella marina]|uniref:DUF2878 domain-containing protein n=1 Tax=Neptunicella marina TaxID=2125989 RepID=A0A8J6IR02_9ALTE|nr:DUF2878 domain-containing protein [Neptunicella marina]MBC3765970.1 DUF2878 domain-containing protein [Neptunicella marina]
MTKPLLSAILFQLFWFACVLGGNQVALVAFVIYLTLHWRLLMQSSNEFLLISLFIATGALVDGVLIARDVIGFGATESQFWVLPPLWLLCLWGGAGSLFSHALVWGQKWPWVLYLAGAATTPLSYLAGAKLTDVVIAEPLWQSYLILATVWLFMMIFGRGFAARRIGQNRLTRDAVASFENPQKKALIAPFSQAWFAYFLEERPPKRLLNFSIRPPLSTLRCLPV